MARARGSFCVLSLAFQLFLFFFLSQLPAMFRREARWEKEWENSEKEILSTVAEK